ncbi:MAG: pyridoxamine 5'-phosphate oxidase family protein [Polyangiales bacterium]
MKRTISQPPKGSAHKNSAARKAATPAVAKRGAAKTTATRATPKASTNNPPKVTAKLVADREHVHAMLQSFSTVMLATVEGEGEAMRIHARPMNIAALSESCTITFMSAAEATRTDESKPETSSVIAQTKTSFITLRGRSEIVRDRERIRQAWKPLNRVHFPEGPDTPSLCLVVFHPAEAELWDLSGMKGMRYLFEAARALVTRTSAEHTAEQHDRIDLRGP